MAPVLHRAGLDDTKVGQREKDDPPEGGEEKVVAGAFKNRVQAAAARVLPDQLEAEQYRKQAEPTGDADETS